MDKYMGGGLTKRLEYPRVAEGAQYTMRGAIEPSR